MMTTPRLALITMVATLAYLGLAVLGWGGFAAFFSHPPLIALAITLLVLSGVAIFSGRNLSSGVREDHANRWALAFRSGVGVLLTGLLIPPLVARIRAEENARRSSAAGMMPTADARRA
jgi:hypothetical protein